MTSTHLPHNIFIIEDSELDNLIAKLIIKKTLAHSKITTCKNGLAAINCLLKLKEKKAKLPDYIFLDLKMPIMNGWEFIEKFKTTNIDPLGKCKIYILTSSLYKDDYDKAMSNPLVTDYIAKPMNSEKAEQIFEAA